MVGVRWRCGRHNRFLKNMRSADGYPMEGSWRCGFLIFWHSLCSNEAGKSCMIQRDSSHNDFSGNNYWAHILTLESHIGFVCCIHHGVS